MYYDESTALNIVVQQPSRVWKGYGDGSTTTFLFDGMDVPIIDKVTIAGVQVYSYTGNLGPGGKYTSISFTTPPSSGSQIRVQYSLGSGRSYNTWSSFGLVPKELPVWGVAAPKTEYKDVDGGSTYYDFTDFNNDTAGYKMSSGTFNFMFANEDPAWNYREANTKVVNALNGKNTLVSFADQPNWERKARLTLTAKPAKNWSTVAIKYDASPYEEYKWKSSEEVPWDELCFEDDPILIWTADAIKYGLAYDLASESLMYDSCWFTWEGPPVMLTFEHTLGYTYFASIKWRSIPVEDDEGLDSSTYASYDTYSGRIDISNAYQNSKLIIRPGQNAVQFSVDWSNKSPTTEYDGDMRITVREARL